VLLTVLNAQHHIDVQIISKVCQKLGKVQRIVVFKRGTIVQAMVEFDNVQAATNAKQQLHGCDIYLGSCTLKAEFAKTDRLNVKRNDEMTWDYTEEFAQRTGSGALVGLPKPQPPRQDDRRDRPVLLNEPPLLPSQGGGMMGGLGGGFGGPPGGWGYGNIGGGGGGYGGGDGDSGGFDPLGPNAHRAGGKFGGQGHVGGPGIRSRGGGAVVMVYGLGPDKFNCQRLFNLFCQYGNIQRIVFLKNKEGTAMVEMDCPESVNKVVSNLNNSAIFDLELRLDWSKKEFIEEVRNPHVLMDGSMSCADFSHDRNNRFDTQERAAKNRIISPTKIVHFYNVPKIEDHDMKDIFTKAGASCPSKVKWFPSKSEKSASGLCEFASVQEACEAIVLVNHTEVVGANCKYPYCMKLCFSPATH
jgi:heterogeneous nuclear ribonucleoprotein L